MFMKTYAFVFMLLFYLTTVPSNVLSEEASIKWSISIGNITSSPAIGFDGTIYVGSLDGFLYAINNDGTFKWTYQTSNKIMSTPAIGLDGTIYVGSHDNLLYAINPDGTKKWTFYTTDDIISSPAIDSNGTIYIGDNDEKFYAINEDGSQKWSYEIGIMSSSPAIASDGTIYCTSDNGWFHCYLHALNQNGTLKWSYSLEGGCASVLNEYYNSSPAIDNNGVVYVANTSHLYAVNPNGSTKWKYKTSAEKIVSSPVIASDGTIYISTVNFLLALNPDGSLKWHQMDNFTPSTPAIGSDGTIYLGSGTSLVAFHSDGSFFWEISPENANGWIRSSPVLTSDGTIYVGYQKYEGNIVWNERFHAINSTSEGLAKSSWPMFRHDIQRTGFVDYISQNDYPPVINNQDFFVYENSSNDFIIGTILATDKDNNKLTYSIIDGNNQGLSIDAHSGKIKIIDNTYLANINTFEFIVQVTDGRFDDSANIKIQVIHNQNPDKPILNLPLNGEVLQSLAPRLNVKPYLDFEGDPHYQSQWIVSKDSNFTESSIILNSTTKVSLISFVVDKYILSENTNYYWKVRFFDTNNHASDWSNFFSFTTPSIHEDNNLNGIPDDQEPNANADLDLDNNGENDLKQANIQCIKTLGSDKIVSIKTNNQIESIYIVDPNEISDTINKPKNFPLGLMSFKINCSIGETVNITIYFDSPAPDSAKWFKYDVSNGWIDYSKFSSFSSDRKSITITIKDGGYGDIDGIENGIIVDPSGYGYNDSTNDQNANSNPKDSESGGGGCFVSTLLM